MIWVILLISDFSRPENHTFENPGKPGQRFSFKITSEKCCFKHSVKSLSVFLVSFSRHPHNLLWTPKLSTPLIPEQVKRAVGKSCRHLREARLNTSSPGLVVMWQKERDVGQVSVSPNEEYSGVLKLLDVRHVRTAGTEETSIAGDGLWSFNSVRVSTSPTAPSEMEREC